MTETSLPQSQPLGIQPAAPPDIQMFRIEEAARITGLCRSTIATFVRDGTLKTVKVKKSRLIYGTSLRALLKYEG
jgi:excisionase family DNA binding protein